MPNQTHVTTRLDNTMCLQDRVGNCIVLRTHVPIPGCGATHARIWWHGKRDVDFENRPDAEIREIGDL